MAQYAVNLSDSGGGSSLQKEISLTGKALAGLEKQTQGLASAISGLFSSFSLDKVMTQAEKTVKRTTTTVRKQTQKALLSFDQIERIGTESTSTTSTTSVTTTTEDATNVTALAAAFTMLQAAISGALGAINSEAMVGELSAIRTAAQEILTLYQTEVQNDIPTWLQGLAVGLFTDLVVLIVQNWDKICAFFSGAAEWFYTAVIQPVGNFFVNLWSGISQWAVVAWENIKNAFASAWEFFRSLFSTIGTLVTEAFHGISAFVKDIFSRDWSSSLGIVGGMLEGFLANVQNIFNAVKSIFTGVVDFVKNVFSGNWKGAWQSIINIFKGIWDGIVAVVKSPINAVIGLINGLISGVVSGINGMISALNKLKFDIPDWIPGIGGKTFGFNMKLLNAPQIPYLAQGAVLPANRPFLAVVGDQKHGTNIEAPLDTIKQALAEVLGSQLPQRENEAIHINFTGDLAQLARVLQPVITRESNRAGLSIAKGVIF